MNDSDPETILKAINKETTKKKPIVFGKVKTRCKMKSQRKLEDLQRKKVDAISVDVKEAIGKEMVEVLQKIQSEFFENEVKSLVETKHLKGKTASIFKLRDRVLGSKISKPDQVILKDPKTERIVTKPHEIRNVLLDCSESTEES